MRSTFWALLDDYFKTFYPSVVSFLRITFQFKGVGHPSSPCPTNIGIWEKVSDLTRLLYRTIYCIQFMRSWCCFRKNVSSLSYIPGCSHFLQQIWSCFGYFLSICWVTTIVNQKWHHYLNTEVNLNQRVNVNSWGPHLSGNTLTLARPIFNRARQSTKAKRATILVL